MEELFDVYDDNGQWRGLFPRSECHSNPELIHRSVHVVVLDPEQKQILLQKRSMSKDIQPGKWDTAVGGHVAAGESVEAAAQRELAEELGSTGNLEFFFESKIRNTIESENVTVFKLISSGPFEFSREEIDEIRFWPLNDFLTLPGRERNDFTPNLQLELVTVCEKLGLI